MGWTTSPFWTTRKDVIKDRIQPSYHINSKNVQVKYTCKAYCVRGGTMWSVWERISIDLSTSDFHSLLYIGCDLIRNYGKEEGYGYKDMCESVGPYYYDCPLKYLDMVPVVQDAEWREKVRKHHAIRNMKLSPGMIVGLDCCVAPVMKLLYKLPKSRSWAAETKDGDIFRVRPSRLSGKTFESWPEAS